MQTSEITKDSNIELEVRYQSHTITLHSKIVRIKDNTFFIKPIKVNNRTLGFDAPCQVNLLYLYKGKLFIWEDINIKLVKVGYKPYYMINLAKAGAPYNRRNSYRISIAERAPVYINTPSGPAVFLAMIKDISSTGIGFITKDVMHINRMFQLKFKDLNRYIPISGKIVRKEYSENLQAYMYGCQFSSDKNTIGKFVSQKQTEYLHKRYCNLDFSEDDIQEK